jgi:GntR family transcriptional regulator
MSKHINTDSRLNQVKTYLLNYIEQNHLNDQTQLPSETAIAQTLGVSRNTLREAYVELEHDGVIIRRHGIGTFVTNSHVIRDSLNEFSPFTQIINESGYTPTFRTLTMNLSEAPTEVCDTFSATATQKVFLIKRIVQADKKPVIYIEDYLNPILHPENLDWGVFDGNMIKFLTTSLNISLHHIQSKIRAAGLNTELSKFLELKSGTPILSVRSIIYKEDNQPVVFSHIFYNSNFVELNTIRMIQNN